MFPCTSAAFTLTTVSDVLCHEVPARPQTRPSMQFLSVASHVCTPASFAQVLADLHLPSASSYHVFIMNPCRHSHRGLPPHYIAPMLGAHPALNSDAAPLGTLAFFSVWSFIVSFLLQLAQRRLPLRSAP